MVKRLLFAPAIEIELHAGPLAILLAHKDGPRVAHPQVIQLGWNERDARIEQLPRTGQFSLPHQHVDGFVGGNGIGDARQRQLHLRHLRT
ncbi:hypothetical protein D3C78_1337010 [compost metagenome]